MKIYSINTVDSNKNFKQPNTQKNTSTVVSRPQINDISNACYKPSFGRSEAEHKSWGAQIDPKTKDVSFKLFTYPDTSNVTVTVKKRGTNETKVYDLYNKYNGVFASSKIPASEVEHGDKYFYTIYRNGKSVNVKDPYSFRQETLLGESTLYDHSLYEWKDADWFKSNKNRISRRANSYNGLQTVKDARIYEFNTASLTKKGTFESAKNVIKTLPQMGFNAIEIMPVENTYSFNWGYDGVDKLAPAEHLGGPDQLKSLIDYAHSVGLNVIMDIVPNHLGPDGASLRQTGPYVSHPNDFGEAFNYEGQNSRYVRDYMVNAALNWLDNYHCDGLRLDMTKYMQSDFTMKQIAAEVNYHKPDAFLIAEDGRNNVGVYGDQVYKNYDEPHDKRVVNPLKDYESGEGYGENYHCEAINHIADNRTSLGRLGYDSEWDFFYYHNLEEAVYGNVNLDSIEKSNYCAQDRVKYVMSHDEIGNKEGTRLIAKLMVPMLNLRENVVANENDIDRAKEYAHKNKKSYSEALDVILIQKSHFVSEKLAILLQSGELDKYNTENIYQRKWLNEIDNGFIKEVLQPLGIKESSGITYNKLKYIFKKAVDINKMALARTYSIPGPKMIFQGDERADMTPFRFFRQFDSVRNEDYLYTDKGYAPGAPALAESTMGTIPYSANGRTVMNKFKNLTTDLNIINAENPALTRGILIAEDTIKHYKSQVLATHAKDFESGNEIYSITNFQGAKYPSKCTDNYYIKFPQGRWEEILNTDDKKFGGTGYYNNTTTIISNGYDKYPIKLPPHSTLMFKRID